MGLLFLVLLLVFLFNEKGFAFSRAEGVNSGCPVSVAPYALATPNSLWNRSTKNVIIIGFGFFSWE